MASCSSQHPTRTQLVDKVPLVNSFWISKPVELPQDIHPLPQNVTDYFVYPYALEQHALTVLPDTLNRINDAQARRKALLQTIADEKERARKARLNALAPGWSEGSVMEPKKRSSLALAPSSNSSSSLPGPSTPLTQPSAERDQMQELVDGLAALDSTKAGKASNDDGADDTDRRLLMD